MRHGKKFNHLSRTASHRSAMLSNMACSLITYKRIKTTLAKAKALRVYVEPILTKSKEDSTHSRRVVFGYLQDKDAVSELFRDVAPKIAERPGGYTRILKLGHRQGDSAEMCFIELVDFNELMLAEKSDKKTTRRSRRGGSKAKAGSEGAAKTTATAPKAEAPKAEAPKAEAPKVEAPKAEAAKAEEVKEEAPKAAEVKTEEVKATEDKVETPAKEEVKEPKKEETTEAKTETPEKKEEENKEEGNADGEEKKKED